MDENGNPRPPQIPRASRRPSTTEPRTWTATRSAFRPAPAPTIGPALAFLFAGIWLLVFPRFWPLPSWLAWALTAVGFASVTLGLLLLGIAIGNASARRHHG